MDQMETDPQLQTTYASNLRDDLTGIRGWKRGDERLTVISFIQFPSKLVEACPISKDTFSTGKLGPRIYPDQQALDMSVVGQRN